MNFLLQNIYIFTSAVFAHLYILHRMRAKQKASGFFGKFWNNLLLVTVWHFRLGAAAFPAVPTGQAT